MKHTTKRLLALLLVLCLGFSLAACAAEKAASGKTTPEAKKGEPDARNDAEAHAPEGGEAMEPVADPKYFSAEMYKTDGSAFAGKGAYSEANPGTPAVPGDAETPGDTVPPGGNPDFPAEPLKLTAAEWKDNDNWPFFTNLVNTEAISFPSFGLDPRNRVEVRVQNEDGAPLVNETVVLADAEGSALWQTRTDKHGTAYLFWTAGRTPDRVICGAVEAPVQLPKTTDVQGQTQLRPVEAVTLTVSAEAQTMTGMQVMFIVDTTGSMSDEIAYLQKDFSAIADRVGSEGVSWSANFYRDEGDEYVTRTNGFTSDVAAVQAKINAEYADGGGDTPEAVAEILTECLVKQAEWDENAVKLAFLIFDAPPHEGKEAELQAAISAAAEKGIHLIPVVASNAERDTELFGRALAILTGGTYVFLTDDSGIGDSHLEPIVGSYEVELLQDLIVRVIEEYRP